MYRLCSLLGVSAISRSIMRLSAGKPGSIEGEVFVLKIGPPTAAAGVFTARCYAERGYEIVCCLSVRLSVCPSECDVQVW